MRQSDICLIRVREEWETRYDNGNGIRVVVLLLHWLHNEKEKNKAEVRRAADRPQIIRYIQIHLNREIDATGVTTDILFPRVSRPMPRLDCQAWTFDSSP